MGSDKGIWSNKLKWNKGYDIRTEMEEFTDRYGDKSRFARYYLIKEKK